MNSTAAAPITTGYMTEPNCGRGTLRIIWSCLATAFLSVWTAYHPQVGKPTESEGTWFKRRLQMAYSFFFLPEVAVSLSLHQLREASLLKRDMSAVPGFKNFSLRQAFLVVIEGVYYERPCSRPEMSNSHPERSYDGSKSERFFYDTARNSQRDPEQQEQESTKTSKYKRLNPKTLHKFAFTREIMFEQLPGNPEIDDRSKSNWVLKSISIFQTLWFLANIIFRLKLGYEITLLEDVTTAFAFCGLIQLLAWIRCPQDIGKPFLVTLRSESEREQDRFVTEQPRVSLLQRMLIHRGLRPQPRAVEVEIATLPVPKEPRNTMIRRILKKKLGNITVFGWLTLTIGTTAFVAIHLGAWNYPFESVTDKWLWRSSCIVSYVSILLVLPLTPYMALESKRKDDDTEPSVTEANNTEVDEEKAIEKVSKPLETISTILAFCHMYSRVTLIVLACTAFRKAPVGIYKEGSWTTFLPHL